MTDYDKELREAWERWEENPKEHKKEPVHRNPEDAYKEKDDEHLPR